MSDEPRHLVETQSFILAPVDATLEPPQSGIELGDLIRSVWRRRWMVLIVTGLSALLALLYVISQPPIYESTATLILQPPRFTTELKPLPFSVETYRTILLSDFIAGRLKETLIASGDLPANTSLEQLQRRLDVQIYQNKESREPGVRPYMPILDLVVKARTGEEAAVIANAWARVFLEESSDLTSQVKGETLQFIESLYPSVAQELEDLEDQLRTRKDQFGQRLLNSTSNWEQTLLGNKARKNREIAKLDTETRQLLADFVNETERLKTEYELETQRQIINFQARWKPDLQKKRLEIEKDKLAVLRKELLDTELEVQTAGDRVKQIEIQLKDQPQFLTLSKSISDEALWQLATKSPNDKLPRELEKLRLESQALNPSYQALVGELLSARVEYNTLRPRKAHLEQEIQKLEAGIDELTSQIQEKDIEFADLLSKRRIGKTKLENDREAQRANLEDERAADLSTERESWASKIAILEARRNDELSRLERERDLRVGVLERKANSLKSSHDLLAGKNETAQLAKMEGGSDVQLAAPAVRPDMPSGPNTLLILPLSLMIGFVLSVILALFFEYLPPILSQEQVPGQKLTSPAGGEIRGGSVAQPQLAHRSDSA